MIRVYDSFQENSSISDLLSVLEDDKLILGKGNIRSIAFREIYSFIEQPTIAGDEKRGGIFSRAISKMFESRKKLYECDLDEFVAAYRSYLSEVYATAKHLDLNGNLRHCDEKDFLQLISTMPEFLLYVVKKNIVFDWMDDKQKMPNLLAGVFKSLFIRFNSEGEGSKDLLKTQRRLFALQAIISLNNQMLRDVGEVLSVIYLGLLRKNIFNVQLNGSEKCYEKQSLSTSLLMKDKRKFVFENVENKMLCFYDLYKLKDYGIDNEYLFDGFGLINYSNANINSGGGVVEALNLDLISEFNDFVKDFIAKAGDLKWGVSLSIGHDLFITHLIKVLSPLMLSQNSLSDKPFVFIFIAQHYRLLNEYVKVEFVNGLINTNCDEVRNLVLRVISDGFFAGYGCDANAMGFKFIQMYCASDEFTQKKNMICANYLLYLNRFLVTKIDSGNDGGDLAVFSSLIDSNKFLINYLCLSGVCANDGGVNELLLSRLNKFKKIVQQLLDNFSISSKWFHKEVDFMALKLICSSLAKNSIEMQNLCSERVLTVNNCEEREALKLIEDGFAGNVFGLGSLNSAGQLSDFSQRFQLGGFNTIGLDTFDEWIDYLNGKSKECGYDVGCFIYSLSFQYLGSLGRVVLDCLAYEFRKTSSDSGKKISLGLFFGVLLEILQDLEDVEYTNGLLKVLTIKENIDNEIELEIQKAKMIEDQKMKRKKMNVRRI